ncbi:CDPK-related kinase 3 [Abeliophyllum distichum]|uniref:CDPK-related kinase 3 n=1 Tax=Abeliophyllum distichum TaxID=126358 RepID=A0ABD1QXC9_9LAMI
MTDLRNSGVTEEPERHQALDKNFGYNKNFGAKFELGKEVGRGHFGHTCYAKGRKGELKDLPVAVKIISKAKLFKRTQRSQRQQQISPALPVNSIRFILALMLTIFLVVPFLFYSI